MLIKIMSKTIIFVMRSSMTAQWDFKKYQLLAQDKLLASWVIIYPVIGQL